ncbi:MAG: GNAT family N-acetyltransferase [Oscillospiraceae bacterium]|jgi:RimJ/RimL family protein N-acetyltransferase|nr:GNAT family N-acetyltransferase [Oscillospiraceae bacterium]
MIFETERLLLREMSIDDLPALSKILQDKQTMRAYEHAFDDEEVRSWLNRVALESYAKHGFGLWAVVLKQTGEMIGQCGLTLQEADGAQVLEIGYLFQRAFWHNGYAAEAATGCRRYAFDVLGADEVCSIIRDSNLASMNVAIRVGMTVRGSFTKRYYGIDMPHYIFSVRRRSSKEI